MPQDTKGKERKAANESKTIESYQGTRQRDHRSGVLAKTELDYNGILAAVEELCTNGHQIGIITVGRTAYRLYQAE